MSKLEELKKEATDLGISFSANIGEAKLATKIEDYYESKETGPVAKLEPVETTPAKKGARTMRERSNEAEKLAKKTRIVTIVDNDQRENHLTTTVSVNCSNDYFDLGTIRLPLNTPVEVAQGFIDVLKEIKIPLHVMNQRTGLQSTSMRNRYLVTDEEDLRKD